MPMQEKETGPDIGALLRALPQKALGQKWVLWAGVLGAALLLVFSFLETGQPAAETALPVNTADVEAIEQQLEARLTQLLAQVEGAGQVRVMVTLESTAQTVYAVAVQQTSDTATDGSSTSTRADYTTDYVLIGDGSGRKALAETTLQPTVKGVAVVCDGAGDVHVVSRITQLVSTVLGIATNRICVTK